MATYETIYEETFDTSLNGWTAFGTGATVSLTGTPPSANLLLTGTSFGASIGTRGTAVPGFVVGDTYRLTVLNMATGSVTNRRIGIDGIGTSAGTVPVNGTTYSSNYSFVATGNSHIPNAQMTTSLSTGTLTLSSVRIEHLLPELIVQPGATVTFDGTTVDITEGSVLLDQQQIPYGSYNITFPIDPTDPPAIYDPRTPVPVTIAMKSGGTTQGTFEGFLRTRTVNEETWTVDAEVTTEEALVSDYATLTQDTTPLSTHSASLRAIVNYTLAEVGLGPLNSTPSNDRDMTPIYDERNLVLNARALSVIDLWRRASAASGDTTGITRLTSLSIGGLSGVTTGIRGTWQSTRTGEGVIGKTGSLTGGQYYQGTAYVRSSVTATVRATLLTVNGDLTFGPTNTPYLDTAVTANVWTKVTIPTQAVPLDTSFGYAKFTITTSQVAGTTLDATGVILTPGNRPSPIAPFFDGSTTDTATYSYEWGGEDVGLSISERTALVPEILPESLIWEPGVSAWDFLEPLVTGAGLRLFADELGVWRMIDPNAYTVAGTVIPGTNLVRASDTIGRDDPNDFATGIVLKYIWTDSRGLEQIRYDTAGTEEKVFFREFTDTPFPGEGAAAAMLARRDGTGHFQNITMMRGGTGTTYQARPYMALTTDLPHIPIVYGRVRSVRFDLTNGLMDIQSTNMDETP